MSGVHVANSSLIQAINKSGFLLERQTAEVFSVEGFEVELNQLLKSSIAAEGNIERLTEIDVLAKRSDTTYVVECKGASSSDKLVLIPSAESTGSFPNVFFESHRVVVQSSPGIFCENRADTKHPFVCHTGDFFLEGSKSDFSKASKQDEKNNLYRGIVQLYFGLDAVSCNIEKQQKIFPTIVTNAEIEIVEFGSQTTLHRVGWAAYRNPMIYPRNASRLGGKPWVPEQSVFSQERRLPLIWVVNINSLKEFICSEHKTYF